MPDVRESSAEAPRRKDREGDQDDEITRIATKVLTDLESFVDESSDVEVPGSDDEDAGRKSSAVIGVSLDELRLILDTSIHRHVSTESTTSLPGKAPVAPSSPTNSTRGVKVYPLLSATLNRSPLIELQQLLSSKQQEFARLREENRAAERLVRAERGRSEDGTSPFLRDVHRTQRDQRRHQDFESLPDKNHIYWKGRLSSSSAENSPQSSVSSSSEGSFTPSMASVHFRSRASHRDQVQPRLPRNNQATETDDTWAVPPPDQRRIEIERAEKACSISPSDLGPAISDLPATSALDLSCRPQLERKSPAHSLQKRYREKRPTRSRMSESEWSSSSSSSRSHSSDGSDASRRHTRRHHHDDRKWDVDNESSHHSRDPHPRDKTEELINKALTPDPASAASEQLDWELDLSNFDI